ncbi:hypothetical protein IQ266_13385 [filamentous cyanobacterium LEGE 11480]|uniref:Uncharacterized protein n=1 Tax=Romeriopsis navalis LEGE 11480 TaxID=2777977 RepID=A0A928Z3I9_9CYAN|nr:hypothetical protein [Romeriopsis navalis]MBE9030724.1 hypothetical protein [Romeriopsis navalis LEGE 11480]
MGSYCNACDDLGTAAIYSLGMDEAIEPLARNPGQWHRQAGNYLALEHDQHYFQRILDNRGENELSRLGYVPHG